MERDPVIIGDSHIRPIRVTTAEGFSVLMACTPAELEQNSCWTTFPGCYVPPD
ncbi:hypothetical protein QTP70_018539, partial [Hemibagrus guttatus]